MANTSNESSKNQDTGGKNTQSGSGKQGFASMDPERQKEIASEGGRAAHAAGTAHEFTSEEAREAGSHSHDNTNASSGGGSKSGGGQSSSGGSSGSQSSSGSSGSSRGGSSEQHAQAGKQSNKNVE